LRKTAQYSRSLQLRNKSNGFTLVELLVVIAIIAVLAAVVILIINPMELTKQSRDTARMSDLTSLNNALNVAVQESTSSGAAILCMPPATAPCSGTSNTLPQSTTRIANGTGWVKVNLGAQRSVSVPTLPADPVNDATYHYTYTTNSAGDKWEVNAVLESQKFQSKMANDGGDNDNVYEVGSDYTIIN
jgi:prepilin-type N-terminal cleavage/methylation domain-containing protein